MPKEGNTLGTCAGKDARVPKETSPENESSLVRIGSKFFSKDSHTERKFNIGFRVEKAPGGIAFKTQNEIIVDKQKEYKQVNKLPTYPGEESKMVNDVQNLSKEK